MDLPLLLVVTWYFCTNPYYPSTMVFYYNTYIDKDIYLYRSNYFFYCILLNKYCRSHQVNPRKTHNIQQLRPVAYKHCP